MGAKQDGIYLICMHTALLLVVSLMACLLAPFAAVAMDATQDQLVFDFTLKVCQSSSIGAKSRLQKWDAWINRVGHSNPHHNSDQETYVSIGSQTFTSELKSFGRDLMTRPFLARTTSLDDLVQSNGFHRALEQCFPAGCMPPSLAVLFGTYSISRYLWGNLEKPFWLIGIMVLNFLYCVLTAWLMGLHWHQLESLGVIYFVVEIIVILGVIGLEWKVYQAAYVSSNSK